jgi:hypothetical protein
LPGIHTLAKVCDIRSDSPEELIGAGDSVFGHVGKLVQLIFNHENLLFELTYQFNIVEELGKFGCEQARNASVRRRRADGLDRHDGDQSD